MSLSGKGADFIQALHMKKGSVLDVFQTEIDALEPREVENLIKTHNQINLLLEAIELKEQVR